jgi:hypothetical protein
MIPARQDGAPACRDARHRPPRVPACRGARHRPPRHCCEAAVFDMRIEQASFIESDTGCGLMTVHHWSAQDGYSRASRSRQVPHRTDIWLTLATERREERQRTTRVPTRLPAPHERFLQSAAGLHARPAHGSVLPGQPVRAQHRPARSGTAAAARLSLAYRPRPVIGGDRPGAEVPDAGLGSALGSRTLPKVLRGPQTHLIAAIDWTLPIVGASHELLHRGDAASVGARDIACCGPRSCILVGGTRRGVAA